MSRLAVVTYDLQPPYDHATANKVMEGAGFSRFRTASSGELHQLPNTTWMADVTDAASGPARDRIADALQQRFASAGLNAKILVVVADDWAWGLRQSVASSPVYRSYFG
jgi:hypothetical protein